MALQLGLALMAMTPLSFAAPPEPPPVQQKSDQGQGAVLRPGVGSPDVTRPATLADVRKLLEYPFQVEEFPGIPLGSFLLFPEITITGTYDDNIYAERGDFTNRRYPVEDFITTISPVIRARSNWERHSLSFELGADIDRYQDRSSEDVNDYFLGAEGRFDLTPNANIFGGARKVRDHEDRGAADALSPTIAAEPTRFDETQLHLGTAFKLGGRFAVRLGGTYSKIDYKDVQSGTGTTIDQDFRDRKQDSLGARVSYELTPAHNLFVQYATDNRRYDQASTGRDSKGYRAALGWGWNIDNKFQGEAYVGTLHQNYDNASYADLNKPYYGVSIVWNKDVYTRVSASLDRSLQETTLTGASGYLDTTLVGRIEHRITANTTVAANASYTQSSYHGIDRTDKIIDAGVGLRYYFLPQVFLGFDYRLLTRDSNVALANYSRNQILLSLGYTPARLSNYSLAGEVSPLSTLRAGRQSGFYVGGQIGHGALTTETVGPRGGEGFDTGDFGNFGGTYALFGGWGWSIGNWYLGLEVDGGDSNNTWYHRKGKDDSRTIRVDKNASFGASARVGYALDGGLFYGKAGLIRTKFRTYYTENQYAPGGAYDRDNTLTDLRVGVGLDIPASEHFFVRMDYSYTPYESFNVPYQSSGGGAITTEKFDVKDSVFSVGLGWRFGGEKQAVVKQSPTSVRGVYLGGSIGHGALYTELAGTHFDQSIGPYAFYGDFANEHLQGGFFGGYGFTISRLYLGVEAEVDAANFGWYHERQTGGGGGRDFAVEKRSGYGAAVRLGYVLNNGALLYGRFGEVQTHFNTTYNKGASAAQYIDRTDRLTGVRYGIGAEVPASRNAFVRMDYTYTKYDSYGFITTHNGGLNPDALTFTNAENLFRLGLGLRF